MNSMYRFEGGRSIQNEIRQIAHKKGLEPKLLSSYTKVRRWEKYVSFCAQLRQLINQISSHSA